MNKKQDIIIAGAIGDAFGYIVEFDKIEDIRAKYGQYGLTLAHIKCLVASDDTQMTLFCLEALLPYFHNAIKECDLETINESIYQSYLSWYKTQEIKPAILNFNSIRLARPGSALSYTNNKQPCLLDIIELYKRQAPGITCLSALGSGNMGSFKYPINDSKGCGGIMRVAPVAFLDMSIEQVFHLGAMQAAITHGHSEGYLSAGFFAGLIKCGLQGYSFNEAYVINKIILAKYDNAKNLLNYLDNYEKVLHKSLLKPEDMNKNLGEGWTGEEALGIALYAYSFSTNFSDLLSIATNHSGDSDSTASLAAQLYATFKNLDKAAYPLKDLLDINQAIDLLINQFV